MEITTGNNWKLNIHLFLQEKYEEIEKTLWNYIFIMGYLYLAEYIMKNLIWKHEQYVLQTNKIFT